jgi:hypothetical protein
MKKNSADEEKLVLQKFVGGGDHAFYERLIKQLQVTSFDMDCQQISRQIAPAHLLVYFVLAGIAVGDDQS